MKTTGDKWKYTVILDEAQVYLKDFNKKGPFTIENVEKKMPKPGSDHPMKVSVKAFYDCHGFFLQWKIKRMVEKR